MLSGKLSMFFIISTLQWFLNNQTLLETLSQENIHGRDTFISLSFLWLSKRATTAAVVRACVPSAVICITLAPAILHDTATTRRRRRPQRDDPLLWCFFHPIPPPSPLILGVALSFCLFCLRNERCSKSTHRGVCCKVR